MAARAAVATASSLGGQRRARAARTWSQRQPVKTPLGTGEEMTDCWFDEPEPGDRRSWALPRAHGTYQGLDLDLLDPGDEDERALLIEARHPEFADALQGDDEVILDGEPVNPRLHMAMHQVVANQLLADDPPETWQTVQRLARLGYDWHNIMHMIASLITEDVY